jgi:trypsin
VLTAAHCEGVFKTIEVNRYDLTSTTEAVETFGFVNTIPHPRYTQLPNSLQFDAMLVKLDGIVSIIDPIRINDLREVPTATTSLTIVGWGVTDEDGSSDIFQEADVTYVPNTVCSRIRNERGNFLGSDLTGDMMCAGDEGIDSCQGDSGSPLISRGGTPEEDIQVGVVSWGIGCAGPIPGVYSRLSTMYGWMRQTVCNKSSDPPDHWECDTPAPSSLPTPASSQVPSTAPSDQPSNVAGGSPTIVDLTDNDPSSTAQNPPFAGFSTTKATYLTFTLLLIAHALV